MGITKDCSVSYTIMVYYVYTWAKFPVLAWCVNWNVDHSRLRSDQSIEEKNYHRYSRIFQGDNNEH